MISQELKEAVERIRDKSEPIVVIGATQSGKSTAIRTLAESEIVQDLLKIRESWGKGTTCNFNILATDYDSIPDDKLIINVKLNKMTIAKLSDDNKFIGGILYSAIKEYCKNDTMTIEDYEEKLKKEISSSLKNAANDTLAYKIKSIGNSTSNYKIIIKEIKKYIFYILSEVFNIDDIENIYIEVSSKWSKKNKRKAFIEQMSKICIKEINEFWKFIQDYINKDIEYFKSQLKNYGALYDEETNEFVVALGEKSLEEDFVELLLGSEYNSKEYLFSNVSLIFRINSNLLKDIKKEDLDKLTVAEHQKKEIHCIRFIDTKGLFHASGVEVYEEAERINDILSNYHSDKMIILINSNTTSTDKDSYSAILQALEKVNRTVDVYILYTHLDDYIRSYIKTLKRKKREKENWKTLCEWALEELKKSSKDFCQAIHQISTSKKPKLIEINGAFDPEYIKEEDVAKYLKDKELTYKKALKSIIAMIISKADKKYRINASNISNLSNIFLPETEKDKKRKIDALYNNMIACKGLKLYASTVRACIKKWRENGQEHYSTVFDNDFGYKNIETIFVREIRNYAMNLLPYFSQKIELNIGDIVIGGHIEKENFIKDINNFMKFTQHFGREVSKLIGQNAYHEEFERENDYAYYYYYERFERMVEYVNKRYFRGPVISLGEELESCLYEVYEQCILDFVNEQCIVIY